MIENKSVLTIYTAPPIAYNTHMENEKFNDNLEIGGDLQDEYQAIQAAEADDDDAEVLTDAEIIDLIMGEMDLIE